MLGKWVGMVLVALVLSSCAVTSNKLLQREKEEAKLKTPENPEDRSKQFTRFQDSCSNKYGFKNLMGEVVIPAKYDLAYPMNSYGIISVWLAGKEDNWYVIDEKGRMLFKSFYYQNGPDYFYRNRARLVGDGQIGFHDMSGKVVIEPDYDQADPFFYNYPYTYVAKKEKWGVIDTDGKVMIPLEYQRDKENEAHFLKDGQCHNLEVHENTPRFIPCSK